MAKKERKTRYTIVKATQREDKGIINDGRELLWSKKSGSFDTFDPALAKDIEQKFGPKGEVVPNEVVVVNNDGSHGYDPGHNYFFGSMPEMPWKKKERENAAKKRKVKEGNKPEHS